jgi:hypothetical protein
MHQLKIQKKTPPLGRLNSLGQTAVAKKSPTYHWAIYTPDFYMCKNRTLLNTKKIYIGISTDKKEGPAKWSAATGQGFPPRRSTAAPPEGTFRHQELTAAAHPPQTLYYLATAPRAAKDQQGRFVGRGHLGKGTLEKTWGRHWPSEQGEGRCAIKKDAAKKTRTTT